MKIIKILRFLYEYIISKLAYAYLSLQSLREKLRTSKIKEKIHYEKKCYSESVVIVALFQKGKIRQDVVFALEELKSQGTYIIAINTSKLKEPDEYSGIIDCYIEKPNFGRDFGSYQEGFKYIYENYKLDTLKRAMVINDSIFFSKKNMPEFFHEMLGTDVEVLGATENHHIEYHLGSFCISICGDIVRSEKFREFWNNYKCTDVRPKVIKDGEMALTKRLRDCASSSSNIRALYDATQISRKIKNNQYLADNLLTLTRTSKVPGWKRLEPSKIKKEEERFIKHTKKDDSYNLSIINGITHDKFIECFMFGSQIHQNNIILHEAGLPLIKLDILYRGFFNTRDIENIAIKLPQEQQEEFKRIIYSRPYGKNVLSGWRKVAFKYGLI